MDRTKNRRNLYLVYMGIFLVIFLLNCLSHRAIGDDYLYSFVWEGHSMYEPLSENARRISSFSDIAESTYSYFMTWGGRIVAQSMAMFFLWMPRMVFNVCIAGATVFLVILIQWIARGGRVTMDLSAREAALIFFCLWTFHANFAGVFIWTDGSCNYLFPLLALLFFLLPYIRHYMSDGKEKESSWLVYTMFPLGILAGNSNENTICWLGLFGFFYLIYAYRKGTLRDWMVSGFLGLTIGYGLLLLAPGNFLRVVDSKETLQNFQFNYKKWLVFWFSIILQSMLWFYMWKGFRNRKVLAAIEGGKKYVRLAWWVAVNSWLFNLIMLCSPEFPNRSLFPGFIFCIIAVFTLSQIAVREEINILQRATIRFGYGLAILSFSVTLFFTGWWYVLEYQYEEWVLAQAEAMKNSDQVLVIDKQPPAQWNHLSGLHLVNFSMSDDENKWQNVAFARFHHLKGVRLVKD